MLRFTANLSLLFNELDLRERFKAARNCGFAAVEIQFPYELPAAAIAELLRENGLKLVLFNVGAADLLQGGEGLAAVPEKRSAFRDALRLAAEYAAVLRPEAINVLPGCCHDGSRLNAYLQTFEDNLILAAQTFAPLHIKTVFEAVNTLDMPGFIVNTGSQMLKILAQLQQPELYLQYDIYHMLRMGENPAEFIAAHAAAIGHIQFADCPGRAEPGTGTADFEQLFDVIEQSPYTGWVGAEYRPSITTPKTLRWLDKYRPAIKSTAI